MRVLKDKRAIACFLFPALLVYTLIVFLPIAESLYYGFIEWNGVSPKVFVGMKNYQALVKDRVFRQVFGNNMGYILCIVSTQIVMGLVVAVLMTYLRKCGNVIRTVFYIPSVITVVAIVQLFRCLYSYEPLGLFNLIRGAFGFEPIAFLSDYSTALVSVSMVEGWQYIGIYMMIFYSALISISKDIEEAARIDGARESQLFFFIKLPAILHVVGLSLILSLVGALRGFAVPMLLTHGGPGNQTEILATYMYKKAFVSMKLGYGSAVAVIIVLISFVSVLFINRVTRGDGE